jgi:hypothetical protein
MYLTRRGSEQRKLTNGLMGWPVGQIPWMSDQLLCRFGPRLLGHVSTREGEGYGGGKSRWKPNSLADRPRG